MQRQLQNRGGMTVGSIRQKYGLGSFVRKLIPNELAKVAEVAAPFIAPFNPLAGAIAGGLGRYDRTGDLGSSALYGGITGGIGVGTRALGGLRGSEMLGGGITNFSSPLGTGSIARNVLLGEKTKSGGAVSKFFDGKGLLGSGGNFSLKGIKEAIGGGVPGIFLGATALAALGQKLAGPKKEDETDGEYLTRRKSSVGGFLRKYYSQVNPRASATDVESFVQRNLVEYKATGGRVGYAMGSGESPQSLYDVVIGIIQEDDQANKYATSLLGSKEFKDGDLSPNQAYRMIINKYEKNNFAQGGRIGYAEGSDDEFPLGDPTAPVNPFAPKPTGPVLPNKEMAMSYGYDDAMSETYNNFLDMKKNKQIPIDMDFDEFLRDVVPEMSKMQTEGRGLAALGDPTAPGKMASMPDINAELFQMFMDAKKDGIIPQDTDFDTYKDLMREVFKKQEPARQMVNMGGMMDIPVRQNKGGITELDMRQSGGFVPVGIKEKADDVPAMLSKNEFVMTADAVRAAGGGSIQKGAQKMYNTMKKLESRVS